MPTSITHATVKAAGQKLYAVADWNVAHSFTIDHVDLQNIGVNTHAQIDTHIASVANPHSVTWSQVGAIQDAADTVKDTHIDWGVGANQVSTTDIPEGTNLYFTTARARAALSKADPVTYNSGTGVIGLGYNATNLKLTATQLNTIQDIATTSNPVFNTIRLNTTFGALRNGSYAQLADTNDYIANVHYVYSTQDWHGAFESIWRSRGSPGAEASVASGDRPMTILTNCYGTNAWDTENSGIYFIVDGAPVGNNVPMKIHIRVSDNTGADNVICLYSTGVTTFPDDVLPDAANGGYLGSASNEWDGLYITPTANDTCYPFLKLNTSTNEVQRMSTTGVSGSFIDMYSNEVYVLCGIVYAIVPP